MALGERTPTYVSLRKGTPNDFSELDGMRKSVITHEVEGWWVSYSCPARTGPDNIFKKFDRLELDPEPEWEYGAGVVRNSNDARGQMYYLEMSMEF